MNEAAGENIEGIKYVQLYMVVMWHSLVFNSLGRAGEKSRREK